MAEEEKCLKCVFVGNAAVGKTSLIVSYTTNGYPHQYVPTAFDNFSVVVRVDRKPIRLQLHDTAGQYSFDTLRPLSYAEADVFIIVFSIVDRQSFDDVLHRWYPEVSKRSPGTRIILVGTQADQKWTARQPVTTTEAMSMAHRLNAEYFECSALTQHNLKEMFDATILAGLEGSRVKSKKNTFQTKSVKIKERMQKFFTRTKNFVSY